MTVEQLDMLAYAGEEMPVGLRMPEQMYFIALRALYSQYKQRAVSKEQSAREKTELLRNLENGMHHEEYVKSVQGLWGRISLASVEYIKNPCLTTAEEFYRVVHNLPEGHRKKPITILPDEGDWEYVLVEV